MEKAFSFWVSKLRWNDTLFLFFAKAFYQKSWLQDLLRIEHWGRSKTEGLRGLLTFLIAYKKKFFAANESTNSRVKLSLRNRFNMQVGRTNLLFFKVIFEYTTFFGHSWNENILDCIGSFWERIITESPKTASRKNSGKNRMKIPWLAGVVTNFQV